ncbi:MAG: hypothetical protein R8J85_02625 [Mariprofundales bacterium]
MNPLLTATLPPAVATNNSASGALRVISEQQLKLAPGQRMTLQVHREGNGVFTLSNGSQTITVEGLPNTITNGTTITVFSGNRGDNMLRWSITSEAKIATTPLTKNGSSAPHISIAILNEIATQPAQPNTKKSTISPTITKKSGETSTLLSSIKPGTTLTGKVLAQQGEQMTVELTISKENNNRSSIYKQNNAPFKLTIATIPDQQVGSTIVASLQRDQEGKPLLLMANNTPTSPIQKMPPPAISERMQPGTQAIGLVQQKLTNGQLRIALRGTEIITPPPPNKLAPSIKIGDGMILRMQPPSPTSPPTLEIRQHLPNILALLQQNIRQLLPNAPPISTAIAALRDAMPPAEAQSSSKTAQHQPLEAWLQRAQHNNTNPITGSRISALIRDSGQLLEHKLLQLAQQSTLPTTTLEHDLKAVLTKLTATSTQQHSPPPSTSPSPTLPPPTTDNTLQQSHQQLAHKTAEAAQQGVQRIESNQMHTALSAIHHEPMRVEFPMVVFNQLVTVQMAIMEQQQHHSTQQLPNEQYFNILMALNLSHLGEVRIDSTVSTSTVLARIHIASDKATTFAHSHLQRLTNKMQAAGFTQIQIVIAKQPPSPEKERAFSQLTSMVPNTATLLDIEI